MILITDLRTQQGLGNSSSVAGMGVIPEEQCLILDSVSLCNIGLNIIFSLAFLLCFLGRWYSVAGSPGGFFALGTVVVVGFSQKRTSEEFAHCCASLLKERSWCLNLGGWLG